jgi:alpha-beta hydrolase superfamily lysophospholipase
MQPSETTETPRPRHSTVISPSLARDLARLKRGAPVIIVVLLIVIACGSAYFATGLMMGPQERWTKPLAPAGRFGLSPQTVSFTSSDGIPLKAWWEQPWSVVVPKGTVILIHGAQMNKTGMAYIAGRLLPRGFSVLVLDLRAHGESGGEYTTFGYKEALDVEAAIRWVEARNPGGKIALLGYSSGSVAALLAAARHPEITAIVADSAYIDSREVLRRENQFLQHPPPNAKVPWTHRLRLWVFTTPGFSWLSSGIFRLRTGVPFDPPEANVLQAVGRIRNADVLFMVAAGDPVIPRDVTQRLFRGTATPRKQLVITPGAYHSAMAGDPRGYMSTVTSFLDQAFGTEPVPAGAADAKNPRLK